MQSNRDKQGEKVYELDKRKTENNTTVRLTGRLLMNFS